MDTADVQCEMPCIRRERMGHCTYFFYMPTEYIYCISYNNYNTETTEAKT